MKKAILLFVLLAILSVGLVAGNNLHVVLSTPTNNTGTRDRTPSFVFTPENSDNTSMNCSVDVGGVYTVSDVLVNNNTATTITSTTSLPDADYLWNVTCFATGNATLTNTSETRLLTVEFASYGSGDVAEVSIDMIVGLGSALFSFIAIIGLVVLWNLVKGKKKKINL